MNSLNNKNIGKMIGYIYRTNQKNLAKALNPYNIGPGQIIFLKSIIENPGISQEKLSSQLKFDKGTTARTVKKLEQENYIERHIDERDRRAFQLYPTQKGNEIYPILIEVLQTLNKKLCSKLKDDEHELLFQLLNKLDLNYFYQDGVNEYE